MNQEQEHIILRLIRRSCRLICHQKPERCFTVGGYLFPICARCTGILLSFTAALILLAMKVYVNRFLAVLLTLIMFVDWLIQFLEIKESTNRRRFITGLVGGFGMSYVFYYLVESVLRVMR